MKARVKDVDVFRLAQRLDAAEAKHEHIDAGERIGRLIAEAKVTERDIAVVLNLTRSAVLNKLAGRRQWQLHDVEKMLALLSARLDRRVTFEEAFGRVTGGRRGRRPAKQGAA